jgi:hypothetical protein
MARQPRQTARLCADPGRPAPGPACILEPARSCKNRRQRDRRTSELIRQPNCALGLQKNASVGRLRHGEPDLAVWEDDHLPVLQTFERRRQNLDAPPERFARVWLGIDASEHPLQIVDGAELTHQAVVELGVLLDCTLIGSLPSFAERFHGDTRPTARHTKIRAIDTA